MLDTNVKLSKEEMMLVNNSGIILTKQIIISKVYELFGLVHKQYKLIIKNKTVSLNDTILKQPGKIYKGEQYLQLPYVLMDYPRCFAKEDVFAIRTFFWWGNFFSITLHLSGSYLEEFKENIIAFMQQTNDGWFICVNDTQWEHDFSEQNYLPLHTCTANMNWMETMRAKTFIKLANRIELSQWENVQKFFIQNFSVVLEILAPVSFQGDERVL